MVGKNCVKKPWGIYKVLHRSKGFKVKLLWIYPKKRTSLQSHRYRREQWIIVKGVGRIYNYTDMGKYGAGNEIEIHPGIDHRVSNEAKKGNLIILELQTGEKLLEKDVRRKQDDWGRR